MGMTRMYSLYTILENNPNCGSRNFREPQSLAGVDGSGTLVLDFKIRIQNLDFRI